MRNTSRTATQGGVAHCLRRLPLALAVLSALTAVPAAAQQTAESTTEPTETKQAPAKKIEATQLDTVSVTGTLLRKPEYENIVPVQVISIEKAQAAGRFDVADMIQSTSAVAGSTQVNNQFGGFVVEGGTGVQTVSLRGLGANRTLVLLDGQRPGPAGTRGQVGAFDLNVVPQAALQRVEIVTDGSSSIYGSDAVAGVVNLITRKQFDRPTMSFSMALPQHGGGEQFSASFADGKNFENGTIIGAVQWDKLEALNFGDRDFLECAQDRVWGRDGQRIDRQDRSIIGNTSLGGCLNLYANTIFDASDPRIRYIPSPDGVTIGPFPGYRPRPFPARTYANSPQAYYEDVNNFPFYGRSQAIDERERVSAYFASDFGFDSFSWKTQWLFNRRETNSRGFRQFFPIVQNPTDGGFYQPVLPFSSNNDITVDYYYGSTKFAGLFSPSSSWAWEVNANFSYSSGDYRSLAIDVLRSGDLQLVDTLPAVDLFDPGFLNGSRLNELENAIGLRTKGNTVYTQGIINALITGDLFSLPAGEVQAAFGAEYRRYRIDDRPDELVKAGRVWGQTSALDTKGSDNVKEIFTEIGVPIVKGKPGFESLDVSLSGRLFDYDSVGERDHVWKLGVNWQIVPSVRVRGTLGTSYRAPGLYELFLGDQTGFLGQAQIDPCVLWGESTNDRIRRGCAAAGIPDDYNGAGASATITTSGGAGQLKPETSRVKTVGVVFSPVGSEFSVALDYFDYDVRGTIAEIGASNIVGGCYGSAVYPNNFCNLFVRNPGDAAVGPYNITDVFSQYVNINQARTRGYDLQMDYGKEFSFGKVTLSGQLTHTIEARELLFDSAAASGQSTSNLLGFIGRPKTVAVADATLTRGDWSYQWRGDYVSSTSALDLPKTFTYAGFPNAVRDIKAGWQLRHSVSATYDQDDWGITFGIRNLFDKAPDLVSAGADSRYGNTPINATQYDWYGRTFFVNANYKF